MKNGICLLGSGLAWLASGCLALAQTNVLSLNQNGVLVCTNMQVGSVSTVEWASTLAGPWQTNWATLIGITNAGSNWFKVSVPMFYRVLVSPPPIPPPTGMASVPAGTFTMGNSSADGDITDATPTSVTVTAFYVDTNLVSYSQWQAVYTYATSHGYGFAHAGTGVATNHPVQSVDWYDAVKWCNTRSQQAGIMPVYYTDAGLTHIFTNGDSGTVYVNWATNGYRLPTEAEWEIAARGGLSGQRFPWGNTISESQANYYGYTNSGIYSYDLGPNGNNPVGNGSTSPVGSFPPNGWGLYDMAGNVEEWCWDWYGTPYAGGTNPHGSASGTYHVLRGGYYVKGANFARCAYRIGYYDVALNGSPTNVKPYIGFRCVRGL